MSTETAIPSGGFSGRSSPAKLPCMDDELHRLKRIDLRAYAAAQGYEVDKRDSWRGSAVMRQGGDKIVISRDTDGHYVYYSFRDERDNGTIIDFVKNRQRLTFKAALQELRRFDGIGPLPALPPLSATPKDRRAVEGAYRRMKDLSWHHYLEEDVGIPREILTCPRFAGRIKVDARANAIFPHFDGPGLCGFEKKNAGFKSFSPGGEKGFWESNDFEGDDRIVFAESGAKAVKYHALHPDEHTRYRSIGGRPKEHQADLIRLHMKAMLAGSTVISAMDNDEAGHQLSGIVERIFDEVGRSDLAFVDHHPSEPGLGWDDVPLHGNSPSLSFSPYRK